MKGLKEAATTMHEATGNENPSPGFTFNQEIGTKGIAGDGQGTAFVEIPQVVGSPGFLEAENDNRIDRVQ